MYSWNPHAFGVALGTLPHCCCSAAKSFLTFCDSMNCSTPGFPVLHYLPDFPQTQVHWVSDAIQPSHPLLSSSPPARNLSQHQGCFFSNELAPHIRWPKYWSFSIRSSNEYSGLISFMMYWLDPFAVQGTLKSLSNTTVQKHQFFGAQLSSQSNSHIYTWPMEKP